MITVKRKVPSTCDHHHHTSAPLASHRLTLCISIGICCGNIPWVAATAKVTNLGLTSRSVLVGTRSRRIYDLLVCLSTGVGQTWGDCIVICNHDYFQFHNYD